jgi:molybdopterin-guanine dinucleotide biosynthesis protein A
VRVIIAAAGEGERWNNYRNTPKHLATIEDEVILNRIVKQFSRYTDDIIIIGKDERYKVEGTTLFSPQEGDWYDFAKIYSSNQLWSDTRTVIVFGDVYFTDDAVDKIMTDQNEYRFFLRKGPSKYTGKGHKEIFAIAFSGGMNQKIKTYIQELVDKKQTGAGAWRLYLHMHNIQNTRNIEECFKAGGYTEINDWTDDFDKAQDILKWEKMRSKFIKK